VAIGLGVGDCEGVGDGVDVADCYVERLEIWSSEGGDWGSETFERRGELFSRNEFTGHENVQPPQFVSDPEN
jgi:hypothetical protein